MSSYDITNAIQAKSDQLNADDLTTGARTIKINAVTKGNAESPFILHYEGDNGRPLKPCKTVLRIIGAGWGNMTGEWVGKSLELYCDPTVVYAGKEVGGIRIKSMSDIPKRIVLMLSKTRGKKVQHTIDILKPIEKPQYPADKFEKAFTAMSKKIVDGSMTAEQVINKCESTGWLTDEQKAKIRDIEKDGADLVIDENVDEFFNGESE